MSRKIKVAGHTPIFSNLTFRSYADLKYESQGSDPYNTNIVNIVAQKESPDFVDSNGIPYINFYTLLYNNKRGWIKNDGVHPNDTGEVGIRNYVVSKLAEIWKSNKTISLIKNSSVVKK
jgi:hypothetical protein